MFYLYRGAIEMLIYNTIIWGLAFGIILYLLIRYPSRWERDSSDDESPE